MKSKLFCKTINPKDEGQKGTLESEINRWLSNMGRAIKIKDKLLDKHVFNSTSVMFILLIFYEE